MVGHFVWLQTQSIRAYFDFIFSRCGRPGRRLAGPGLRVEGGRAEYLEENAGTDDAADQLGDPVAEALDDGHPATHHKADGDRRVDVGARDRPRPEEHTSEL